MQLKSAEQQLRRQVAECQRAFLHSHFFTPLNINHFDLCRYFTIMLQPMNTAYFKKVSSCYLEFSYCEYLLRITGLLQCELKVVCHTQRHRIQRHNTNKTTEQQEA